MFKQFLHSSGCGRVKWGRNRMRWHFERSKTPAASGASRRVREAATEPAQGYPRVSSNFRMFENEICQAADTRTWSGAPAASDKRASVMACNKSAASYKGARSKARAKLRPVCGSWILHGRWANMRTGCDKHETSFRSWTLDARRPRIVWLLEQSVTGYRFDDARMLWIV